MNRWTYIIVLLICCSVFAFGQTRNDTDLSLSDHAQEVAERNAQMGFNDTIDRLAEDFVFRLTRNDLHEIAVNEGVTNLKSQIVISSSDVLTSQFVILVGSRISNICHVLSQSMVWDLIRRYTMIENNDNIIGQS